MKEKYFRSTRLFSEGKVFGILLIGTISFLLVLPFSLPGISFDWSRRLYYLLGIASSGTLLLVWYARYKHAGEYGEKSAESLPAPFLSQISQAAHASQHLDEFFGKMYQIVNEFLPARQVCVFLSDPIKQVWAFPDLPDEPDDSLPVRQQDQEFLHYVFRAGTPVLMSSETFETLRTRKDLHSNNGNSAGMRWVGVPLTIQSRTIGAFAVQNDSTARRYEERDKELLAAISPHIALAIEQVYSVESLRQVQRELEQQVEQKTAKLIQVYEQLATFYELGYTITASLQLEQVLNTIVRSTTEVLETDTAVIFLREGTENVLHLKAGYGLSEHLLHIIESQGKEHIAFQVLQSGQSLIDNTMPPPSWLLSEREPPLACASVPLRRGERIIGTLDVYSQSGSKTFTQYHVQLLEMLASQAAIAIENAQLYEGLQQVNDDLEQQIQERTAELMKTNNRLRHEIRERTRAENALIEERNLLRALIDHLPDYMYVKNTQTQFLIANNAIVRLVGARTIHEVIGKTDFDFYPHDLAERYYTDEQQVLSSGQPLINREEPVMNFQNEEIEWLRTTKIPFRDSQGKILGLVGISHDITELKHAHKLLERQNRELELLNRMNELFQSCQQEEDTYRILMNICEKLFPENSGCLTLFDYAQTHMKCVACWGNSSHQPYRTNTVAGDERCSGDRRDNDGKCADHPFSQLTEPISIPITAANEKLGMLSVYFKNGHAAGLNARQREHLIRIKRFLLPRIVDHYALSLTNLRLREKLRLESIHDSLTGLYNRRYMEAALQQEAARIKRHNTLLGIIMIDVDHFKAFNDQHGHHVGDVVLEELGRFLKTHIRGEDVACRYGGEEFLLILSGASLENTKQRAEEFWAKLCDLRVQYQERFFSITASIGVAALPYHGPDVMDVVRAADDALYLAKERGRNQVVVAPYEM